MKYIKIIILALTILLVSSSAQAASTPTLSLTNVGSAVSLNVTGADPNATVMLYYPNASGGTTFTSIDIGKTNSNGAFFISIAANSYGLNGGTPVYVSVNSGSSAKISWPTTTSSSAQSGALTLSRQNVVLTSGLTATIFPMNTSNLLSVQANSNSSVASAYFQSTSNSVIITGQNTGSTTISICAGTLGCSSVSVSVEAPTQTITFSQSPAYVVLGNAPQSITIYGPGSGYSVSNPNQNILATSLSGSSISLQGLSLGQVTLSLCADGWKCGSLVVNIVSAGTAVPNQVIAPAPANSNFSQSPQLTSFSVTSNNVSNLFFGANSTLNINFGVNQTVNNVQAKIAGQQSAVNQGSNGTYATSYMLSGNETLPLPVVISYTNPSGLTGQNYFWLGTSATLPTNSSASTNTSTVASGPTSFTSYLYSGMTKSGVYTAEVAALQQRLKTDGFYSGAITGYFGPVTKTAVEAYQKKNGLDPIGVIGPGTRALLNKGI